MTDIVTVQEASTTPTVDAVVTLMVGVVGAHIGILYRCDDTGTRRHLHQAWHLRLMDDLGAPADAMWIEPRLSDFELSDVRASARLIARRRSEGRVPYAFKQVDSSYTEAGVLELNRSRGLTCATFVGLVFAHAGITLLDIATWDERTIERDQQDRAAQTLLVDHLRRQDDTRDHAELVASEIGCTRIRAEELAAASGMSGYPISFARAEPEGQRLLTLIQRGSVGEEVRG